MLIDDLDAVPASFKEGYRGILLMLRTKDGETQNAQRKAINKIVCGSEEWTKTVLEYREMQLTTHPKHRIYASVNARDPIKAVREFKRRQLDHDYESPEQMFKFYADIKNRMFSCFMNPACKVQSNMLIDCDTDFEYAQAKERIPADAIAFEYKTKNGNHIIVNASKIIDTRFWNICGQVDIKKDDLLYIG